MSRFGGNTHNMNNCRFASYNPFHQEVVFQKQNHWELLRNNIDLIIQQSKLLKHNEQQCCVEEQSIETAAAENSRCNEIETIYECVEEPEPVSLNPIALDAPPKEEIIITEPTPSIALVVQEEEPKKKRMDFASVVFKYRNELARRKHKELQSST